MALGIAIKKRSLAGACKVVVAELDFDSSYPTGGEALTAKDLGFDLAIDLVLAEAKKGFAFEYDYTNSKIKVLCPAFVAGAAGAVAVDDHPLTGLGSDTTKSLSFGPAGAATVRLGGQQEIANTTDLSTLTDVRIIAFGDNPNS